jgi:hypothetical protein
METTDSPEPSVKTNWTTEHYLEDIHRHSHCHKNLNSCIVTLENDDDDNDDCSLQLIPHQSWVSGHMSTSATGSTDKSSPPPFQPPAVTSSSPPAPAADPDAPLNLTKPKAGSGTNIHSLPLGLHSLGEQPAAATTPKLLPPSLVMPRAFLPYGAVLPPHLSPLPPSAGE